MIRISELSPEYHSLLQNLLDKLVTQSAIILVSAYHKFNPHSQQYEVVHVSIGKKAPRKYRDVYKMTTGKIIQYPAGKGYLRDQVLLDGITRVILNGIREVCVYRFMDEKLSIDNDGFPPDKIAISAAGLSNYVIVSTRVPISNKLRFHTGYFSLVLPDNFTVLDFNQLSTELRICENIIHSKANHRIYLGLCDEGNYGISGENGISNLNKSKRKKNLVLFIVSLVISIPILLLIVYLLFPYIISANQNLITVIAVIAEIIVAILFFVLSDKNGR